MLAALRAGGAGAVGLGGGALAALRGAGAAVLSARPYSSEPTTAQDVGDMKVCRQGMGDSKAQAKQLQDLAEHQQAQAKRLEMLMAGTTPHQEVQARAKRLEMLMAGTTPHQQAQAKRLEMLMAGTTSHQEAQAKRLEMLMAGTTPHQEARAKRLEMLMAGTTPHQKGQTAALDSLKDWRTSIVAISKCIAVAAVAGGAYVQLFM